MTVTQADRVTALARRMRVDVDLALTGSYT